MINIFQVATNDQSLYFLGRIFGNVGTVLSGTGPDLLGRMFKIFNTGVLALGAILVVYTTIMGVLGTAHEGEFLSRKMHSMWVPIRTVVGIAGLMPTSGGYCVIQMVLMWLIIQGVGVADAIWSTVIDYFESGASISLPTNLNSEDTYTGVQQLFSSLVCQSALEKFYCTNANGGPGFGKNDAWCNASHDFSMSQQGTCFSGSGGQCYQYSMGPRGICNVLETPVTGPGTIEQVKQNAYSSMVPTLRSIADIYVSQLYAYDSYVDPDVNKKKPPAPPQWLNDQIPGLKFPPTLGGGDAFPDSATDRGKIYWKYVMYPLMNRNFVRDSANYFIGVIDNFTTRSDSPGHTMFDDMDITKTLEDGRADGWIYAGSYYFAIGKITSSVVGDVANSRKISISPVNSINKNQALQELVCYSGAPAPQCKVLDMYDTAGGITQQARSEQAAGGGEAEFGGAANVVHSSAGHEILDALNPFGENIVTTFMDMMTGSGDSSTPTDPLVNLQAFGWIVLGIVYAAFLAIMVLIFGISSVASIASCMNPLAWSTQALFNYTVPMILAVLGIMFTFGATLAIYVPLVPYMIFTFGAIGWMIATIETMIAAPIVALGIMHPEGQHELWGSSQQAIMIILNIFLRPSLMVFGMFSGMLLSYVVILFINAAFSNVVGQIMPMMGPIEACLFIGAYTGLVIISLNKCFALIHMIPDRILRWLGHTPETFGETEGIQEMGQRFQGAASTVSAGGQKYGGTRAQTGLGAAKEKAEKDKAAAAATSVSGGSSSGGGAGGGGAGGGGGGGAGAGGGANPLTGGGTSSSAPSSGGGKTPPKST